MEIAKGDNVLRQIETQIQDIHEGILKQRRNVSKSASKNTLLEDVADNYQEYCDTALKSKRDEEEALWRLSNYIQDTANEQNADGYLLEELKNDQDTILKELKDIKKHVNYIKKHISLK